MSKAQLALVPKFETNASNEPLRISHTDGAQLQGEKGKLQTLINQYDAKSASLVFENHTPYIELRFTQ